MHASGYLQITRGDALMAVPPAKLRAYIPSHARTCAAAAIPNVGVRRRTRLHSWMAAPSKTRRANANEASAPFGDRLFPLFLLSSAFSRPPRRFIILFACPRTCTYALARYAAAAFSFQIKFRDRDTLFSPIDDYNFEAADSPLFFGPSVAFYPVNRFQGKKSYLSNIYERAVRRSKYDEIPQFFFRRSNRSSHKLKSQWMKSNDTLSVGN